MPVHTVKIGTSYGALALLSSYNISNPSLVTPVIPYSVTIPTASGAVRGQGGMACMWRWAVLETAERTALRVLIPGASAEVYIETPDEDYNNDVYFGVAKWQKLEPDKSHLPSFELFFQNLTVYTP
jgi:hypothetical protein